VAGRIRMVGGAEVMARLRCRLKLGEVVLHPGTTTEQRKALNLVHRVLTAAMMPVEVDEAEGTVVVIDQSFCLTLISEASPFTDYICIYDILRNQLTSYIYLASADRLCSTSAKRSGRKQLRVNRRHNITKLILNVPF